MDNSVTDNKLLRYIDGLIGLTGLIAVLIVTVGVIFRFILKTSMAWSDEVLRTVFVWSYFIGAAMQYKYHGLMRLELIDSKLKDKGDIKAYKAILLVQEFIMFLFASIITYYATNIIKIQVINKQVTTTSGSPAWIFTLGFGIGMFLLVVFSIQKIFNIFKLKENKIV